MRYHSYSSSVGDTESLHAGYFLYDGHQKNADIHTKVLQVEETESNAQHVHTRMYTQGIEPDQTPSMSTEISHPAMKPHSFKMRL